MEYVRSSAWPDRAMPGTGRDSFDHADIYGDYGAEGLFGEALALQPGLRDKMQLVSKCGIKLLAAPPGHTIQHYDTSASAHHQFRGTQLRQLQTDHLDLLLIHRPDPLMDFDEIAGAFTQLQARARCALWRLELQPPPVRMPEPALALVTNQVEFSPLHVAPLFDETFDGLQDWAWRR
jgi:predicted oxidoreductase